MTHDHYPLFRILSLNEQTQLTTSPTVMRCTYGDAKSAAECPLYLPSFAVPSACLGLTTDVLISFVTASQAASERLAFVNPAGNAIMKVDNTTVVPFNDKRNTVRISTKDRFAVGSVWIADMLHVPFGVNQAFAPAGSLYLC